MTRVLVKLFSLISPRNENFVAPQLLHQKYTHLRWATFLFIRRITLVMNIKEAQHICNNLKSYFQRHQYFQNSNKDITLKYEHTIKKVLVRILLKSLLSTIPVWYD